MDCENKSPNKVKPSVEDAGKIVKMQIDSKVSLKDEEVESGVIKEIGTGNGLTESLENVGTDKPVVPNYKPGDKVDVRYRREWQPATVSRVERREAQGLNIYCKLEYDFEEIHGYEVRPAQIERNQGRKRKRKQRSIFKPTVEVLKKSKKKKASISAVQKPAKKKSNEKSKLQKKAVDKVNGTSKQNLNGTPKSKSGSRKAKKTDVTSSSKQSKGKKESVASPSKQNKPPKGSVHDKSSPKPSASKKKRKGTAKKEILPVGVSTDGRTVTIWRTEMFLKCLVMDLEYSQRQRIKAVQKQRGRKSSLNKKQAKNEKGKKK
mmetsp:Transcript_13998/g.21183  ORF Transcript_13998/g.21183 Transcript_13998/m.21183 type:complete len:319 (+) Transcript_13998:87-1043(+)